MQTLVITILGQDRPGIVDELSRLIVSHQGNWQSSSLSKMAGQFAGIVQLTLPDENTQIFSQQLQQIEELQSVVTLDKPNSAPAHHSQVEIELTGNDRPGIVQEITQAIHQSDASVIKMHTRCESAANWGGRIIQSQHFSGATSTRRDAHIAVSPGRSGQ